MKIQVKKDVMDMYSIKEFIGKRVSIQTNRKGIDGITFELTNHTNIPDSSKDYIAVYVVDFYKVLKTLKKSKGFFRSDKLYYYKMSISNYYGNYDYNFIIITQLKPNKKNYTFINRMAKHLFGIDDKFIYRLTDRKGECIMNYNPANEDKDKLYSLRLKPKVGLRDRRIPLFDAMIVVIGTCLIMSLIPILVMYQTDQVKTKLYNANQQIQELETQNKQLVEQIKQINAKMGGKQ